MANTGHADSVVHERTHHTGESGPKGKTMAVAKKQAAAKGDGVLDTLPPALVEQFAQMARTLPRADEDGGARMLEAILNASDPQAINRLFDPTDSAKIVGEDIIVESMSVSESDHAGGLGLFLIVQAVRVATGEAVTFTTGSTNVVAALVRAHCAGWLPVQGKVTQTDKPTKGGFYPQQFIISKTNA